MSVMNKFISTIKSLNFSLVEQLLNQQPAWIEWHEDDGKNALHYVCGIAVANDVNKVAASLQILKLLLKSGMDINSVQIIKGKGCDFHATPLWYAYTRGRNEKLYTYLLKNSANPNNCMYAIAWYDDVQAANLFKKYGAETDVGNGIDTPFLAAFNWKRFNMTTWLLKNGANVNAVDDKGNPALFYAVKKKYPMEQIQLLLNFGADINQENKAGVSPKKLAEQNRQRKISGLFSGHK